MQLLSEIKCALSFPNFSAPHNNCETAMVLCISFLIWLQNHSIILSSHTTVMRIQIRKAANLESWHTSIWDRLALSYCPFLQVSDWWKLHFSGIELSPLWHCCVRLSLLPSHFTTSGVIPPYNSTLQLPVADLQHQYGLSASKPVCSPHLHSPSKSLIDECF